jgi:glutamate synthase (ferredoxin)
VAYVLDEAGDFPGKVNAELVQVSRLMDTDELALVYDLVREHFEKTASRRAEAILNLWDVYRGQLWKVAPKPNVAEAPPAARPAEVPNRAALRAEKSEKLEDGESGRVAVGP